MATSSDKSAHSLEGGSPPRDMSTDPAAAATVSASTRSGSVSQSRMSKNELANLFVDANVGETTHDVSEPRNFRKRKRTQQSQTEDGEGCQTGEGSMTKKSRYTKSTQDPSKEAEYSEQATPRKKPRRPTTSAPPKPAREPSPSHIILEDEKDARIFIAHVERAGHVPARNRILETHLNASNADEVKNFYLALALQTLHPRTDGTNPHQFEAIKLVVKGMALYTRYSYHLASPASSEDASTRLKKLVASGGLSAKKQSALVYALQSSKTSVARALLEIRGLKEVLITGPGRMEGAFAQAPKVTLTQPTGTGISKPLAGDSVDSFELYREGVVKSTAYRREAARPFTSATSMHGDDTTGTSTSEREFLSLDDNGCEQTPCRNEEPATNTSQVCQKKGSRAKKVQLLLRRKIHLTTTRSKVTLRAVVEDRLWAWRTWLWSRMVELRTGSITATSWHGALGR